MSILSVGALVGKSDGSRPVRASNLDSTGTRVVRKGCVVEFPGGATGRVTKVLTGHFWHDGCHTAYSYTRCRDVRVVA